MTSRGEQEQDEYDWGMMQQGDKAPPRPHPLVPVAKHKGSGNWRVAFWLAVFVTVCFLIIWAFN